MENEPDFSNAARKALFRSQRQSEGVYENIPGAGRSAAEAPERHVRAKVTMNLDGDIVAYFKNEASRVGRPYQALINQVLREYIEGSRPEKLAREVAELLGNDESFLNLLHTKLKNGTAA
jgi:uncharacterized protein (DUF4415 family)